MADRHVVFKQCLKEVAEQARALRDVHGEVRAGPRRARAATSISACGGMEQNAFAGDTRVRPGELLGRLPLVSRRLDRARAGRDGVLRADGQLVQAIRGRLVGADAARLELRQSHRRLPRRGPRTEPCASSAASPAPTAIRTSRLPRRSPPGSTASATASSRPSASAATSTRRGICRACRTPCREATDRSRQASSRRRAFGDEVVEHYAHFFRTEEPPSAWRSPTGSAGDTSNGSDRSWRDGSRAKWR